MSGDEVIGKHSEDLQRLAARVAALEEMLTRLLDEMEREVS